MTEDLHGCFEEAHPAQDKGPATEQGRNVINEAIGLGFFFSSSRSCPKKLILSLMHIRTAILKTWLGSSKTSCIHKLWTFKPSNVGYSRMCSLAEHSITSCPQSQTLPIIPKLFHLYTFHSIKRCKSQQTDVKNEALTKAVSYSDFQICNFPYDTTSQTNQHHEKAKFTDRRNPPNHDIAALDVTEEQLSPLLPGHLQEPLQGRHDSVTLCNEGTATYKRPSYTLRSLNI